MALKKSLKKPKISKRALIDGSLFRGKLKIGKRLQVDHVLRETNAFLDSVIENIPHMIFVKDAKELRFVRFNKAGEDLLGYPKSKMIGKNDYDFFPLAEADFFTHKDREVLRKGRLFDIPEEPIHTKRKGIRILRTKKIPILNAAGKAAYLLGISEDITERLRLEREIAAISDREQRRMGQDLHDGLGQHLTGVAFLIKGLAQRLGALKLSESGEANKIAELINQAIGMTRNLARILNPVDLESGGVDAALKDLALNTEKVFGIRCELKIDKEIQFPDPVIATQLFRIAREAVDNSVKHGHATKISIQIEKSNRNIRMEIEDNGLGMPVNWQKHRGMGISNMTYRAKIIGAQFEVGHGRNGGTIVTCSLPTRFN